MMTSPNFPKTSSKQIVSRKWLHLDLEGGFAKHTPCAPHKLTESVLKCFRRGHSKKIAIVEVARFELRGRLLAERTNMQFGSERFQTRVTAMIVIQPEHIRYTKQNLAKSDHI